MVEKPPLHIYDIYLEVEAHGGHGGIWRPFYLSHIWSFGHRFCDLSYHIFPRKVLATTEGLATSSDSWPLALARLLFKNKIKRE